MKSTEGTSTTTPGEIDEMLKRWPEVAAPTGGYDALVERAEQAVAAGRAVDEGLDVFARPALPDVPGEPSSEGGNGDGPNLETLAALARESTLPQKRESRLPEKSAPAKDPRSGVINLKAMIEQAAQQTEATALASALTKDGAPSMGAAPSSTPAASPALPTTQPSTPVVVAVPQKKSSSSMLAVAAIVVIAGVGAYVMLDKQRAPSEEPTDRAAADEASDRGGAARSDRNEEGEDRTAERQVAEAAPVTTTSAAEPSAAPAPAAATPTANGEEPAREGGASPHRAPRGGAAAEGRPGAGGGEHHAEGAAEGVATPPPAAPAPPAEPAPEPAPAPTKRATQDLDALINGSLGPGGASSDPSAPAAQRAAAAAPEGALPQPNRQQIQRGMGRVAGAIRACANGQTGMVMLRITFMSDGSVSAASVASGPFAGSAVAGCMENAARAARVPAFTNASVTVNYPVMVQPPDPAAGAAPAP